VYQAYLNDISDVKRNRANSLELLDNILDEYPSLSRGIIMTLSRRLRKTLEMK